MASRVPRIDLELNVNLYASLGLDKKCKLFLTFPCVLGFISMFLRLTDAWMFPTAAKCVPPNACEMRHRTASFKLIIFWSDKLAQNTNYP